MTVFKYYFKIVKEFKWTLFIYTIILVGFAVFSFQTNDTGTNFTSEKPSIVIINHDQKQGLTRHLYQYLSDHTTVETLSEDNIDDALFYKQIAFSIEIPKNYHMDFLNGKNPQLKIKTTDTADAAYVNLVLNRYLKVSQASLMESHNEQQVIKYIDQVISKKTTVETVSKIDTNLYAGATFYYNFLNYSMLASCVFVVATVMASFRNKMIERRTKVSSLKSLSYQGSLFLGNFVFAMFLWVIYIAISIILMPGSMLGIQGILYAWNSFIFLLCSLSIAYFIGMHIKNKEAINGIVNVLALGSSFLCGAFVPVQYLPQVVLNFAHFLPSYWYIQNNEMLSSLEDVTISHLGPYFSNQVIILIFTIAIFTLSYLISKRKKS